MHGADGANRFAVLDETPYMYMYIFTTFFNFIDIIISISSRQAMFNVRLSTSISLSHSWNR
jgi:hypothetical protein